MGKNPEKSCDETLKRTGGREKGPERRKRKIPILETRRARRKKNELAKGPRSIRAKTWVVVKRKRGCERNRRGEAESNPRRGPYGKSCKKDTVRAGDSCPLVKRGGGSRRIGMHGGWRRQRITEGQTNTNKVGGKTAGRNSCVERTASRWFLLEERGVDLDRARRKT